ncbi:MAG: hypothetical protein OXC09_12755 [Truepera sp.]|nr:hypothetical protein [Truepera sp.]
MTLDLDDYEDEFKELERILETECEELLEALELPDPGTPEQLVADTLARTGAGSPQEASRGRWFRP